MNLDQTAGQRRGLRLTAVCAAMAAAFALPGSATAFEINTGNEDISMRWDNTVRLNIVDRVESQDAAILKNPNCRRRRPQFRPRPRFHARSTC